LSVATMKKRIILKLAEFSPAWFQIQFFPLWINPLEWHENWQEKQSSRNKNCRKGIKNAARKMQPQVDGKI
jgi:hypothetical protein